jgi:hypothetical protein
MHPLESRAQREGGERNQSRCSRVSETRPARDSNIEIALTMVKKLA